MSVSSAKLLANRLNARKSTGPRTPRGKAIAAANALRHGAFARHLLLSGEASAELTELKVAMLRRLNPRDPLELELVERVVAITWKLRRLERFEALLYERECRDWEQGGLRDRESYGLGPREPLPADVAWQDGSAAFRAKLERLAEQERCLERAMDRSLRQLTALQKLDIFEPLTEFAAAGVATEQRAEENRQNEATAVDELDYQAAVADTRQQRIERTEDRQAEALAQARKAKNEAKRKARRAARQEREEARARARWTIPTIAGREEAERRIAEEKAKNEATAAGEDKPGDDPQNTEAA